MNQIQGQILRLNVYCLATITKDDFRAMKGPPGAILYEDDGNNFKIGFLQSEFDELEKAIDLNRSIFL